MSAPAAIRIRVATADDVRTLADIGYAAWERDLLPFLRNSPALRAGERQRLHAAVSESIGRIIVAEARGVTAGWCSRSARRPYIPYLFVTPAMQNHGVGTCLLRRMESLLELEGHDRVQLETLADNVRAVHFYEHQGYRILAMKPGGHAVRDSHMSVRLEKRLSPFEGEISDIG